MDIIELLGLPVDSREEIITALATHYRDQNRAALAKKGVSNAEISLSDIELVNEAFKQQIVVIWTKYVQRKKQQIAAKEGADEVNRKMSAQKTAKS